MIVCRSCEKIDNLRHFSALFCMECINGKRALNHRAHHLVFRAIKSGARVSNS